MGLIVATTIGLSIWLILWSIGAKSLDAFLITITIIIATAGVRMALQGKPDRDLIDQ